MNGQSITKAVRKSFRSSQKPRFCINFQKILCFILLFLFLMCIFINQEQTAIQQAFAHRHKKKEQNQDNESAEATVRNLAAKQQMQRYCLNAKCHEGEVQILQLIANMMSDRVVEEHSIKTQTSSQKQGYQVQKQVLLPTEVQKQKRNSNFYQNLQEYELSAVLDHKITTQKYIQSNYIGLFLDLFIPKNPYEGINCLFQNSNCFWQPSKKNAVLTVQSKQKIQPRIIQIQSNLQITTKVQIIGLILTAKSEILGVQLGKFSIDKGLNWLQCKRPFCMEEYSMIMFKMEKMSLAKLRIYQKLIC